MQDRYAGDVGDFGKFALLEALHEATDGTLGVVWYRVLDESHNNDGRHTGYKNQPSYQGLNDALLQSLRNISDENRTIANLERHINLLKGAKCYSDCVPSSGRAAWLERASKAVHGCSTVFLDPDNGISHSDPCGVKHVSETEVQTFFGHDTLLVIYQHFDRSGNHNTQLANKVAWLSKHLPTPYVFGIRYRRGTSRGFLVATKNRQVFENARKNTEERLSEWIRRTHFDRPYAFRPHR